MTSFKEYLQQNPAAIVTTGLSLGLSIACIAAHVWAGLMVVGAAFLLTIVGTYKNWRSLRKFEKRYDDFYKSRKN